MRIIQYRKYREAQTESLVIVLVELRIVHRLFLLELPWRNNIQNESCIPEGNYILKKRKAHEGGSRINHDHFEVMDVINRAGIKWHIANYKHELRGCGAPGMRLGDINQDGLADALQSRTAMSLLWSLLDDENELTIL